MSIKLVAQLLDNEDADLAGPKLLIMLCIAEHASNGDGDSVLAAARLAFLLHGWLVGAQVPTNQLENWILTGGHNWCTIDP